MKIDLNKPLHKLVLAGLLAGCVLLLTIAVPIPIPNMAGAYINPGDTGVYVAAYLLGAPWGVLAAAAGSALADILLGSILYAGPTFLIKGLMAFVAAKLLKSWQGKKLIALLCAGILMPLGYFLYETALYGAATAMIGVPLNLIQYVIGVVLGLIAIKVLERFNLIKR